MSKLKSLLIVSSCLISGMVASACVFADDAMGPPKPLNNSTYDSMVGTWKGEADMMGKKMNDTLIIHWALNHQYLVMDLTSSSVGKPMMKYEGKGIFGLDNKGKVKSWWFDSWGADSVATGTGDASNNKLTLEDANEMFKETRSFEINKNSMVMHAKGTMNMQGKETPFDQTITYKKQGK